MNYSYNKLVEKKIYHEKHVSRESKKSTTELQKNI